MGKPPLRVVGQDQARVATAETADQLSEQWSDEVLSCRSGLMRHQFKPYTAVHNKKLKYFYVVLRCPRCTTRKHFELDEHGRVLGRPWYSYPPGYLSKGTGRILGEAADVVRAKAVRRLFQVAVLTPKEAKEDNPRPSTLTLLQGGEQ